MELDRGFSVGDVARTSREFVAYYDKMVNSLREIEVRQLFEWYNDDADKHDHHSRAMYLALYRRLHG